MIRPHANTSPLVSGMLGLLALAAGLGLWLHYGGIEFVYGWQRWLGLGAIGAAVLVLFLPSKVCNGVWRRVLMRRQFSPTLRKWTTLLIGLAAAAATAWIFFHQGGDVRPSVCDEYSYAIQAQMLSRLKLYGPPHELPQFFTTFQLVAEPVYGSIYMPGTSLWLAPWALLDRTAGTGDGALLWPAGLIALGVTVALTYRVTAEIVGDDRIGLLAAAVLWATPMFRSSGMMPIGQSPAAMLALCSVYFYLKWRRAGQAGDTPAALLWAGLAGAAVGWGLIVRPMDVLAYALPAIALVGVPLILFKKVGGVGWGTRLSSVLAATVCAIPFGLLTLPLNKAITGHHFETSFGWYAENFLPGTSYGLDAPRPLDAVPPNDTPHYQLSYRTFTRRYIRDHVPQGERDSLGPATSSGTGFGVVVDVNEDARSFFQKRVEKLILEAAPHMLMLALATGPLLLFVLRPRRRWRAPWLLFVPIPLSLALYYPYGFYLPHYASAVAPAMAASTAVGVAALALAVGRASTIIQPSMRKGWRLAGLLLLALIDLALVVLLVYFADALDSLPMTVVAAAFAVVAMLALVVVATLGLAAAPTSTGRSAKASLATVVLFGGCLIALATRGVPGPGTATADWYQIPELRLIDELLEEHVEPNSVVFFTPPDLSQPLEADPVYNLNAMHPDEAVRVRAHDRGAQNADLIAYYARVQPERVIYHFDRRDRTIRRFGTAAELAGDLAGLRAEFGKMSQWWRTLYREAIDTYDAGLPNTPVPFPILDDPAPAANDGP